MSKGYSTIVKNGNYVIEDGQLLNGNSLITRMYMCIFTPIGSWLYDQTLGSPLISYLNGNIGIINRTGIVTIVKKSLDRLIIDGSIAPNPQIKINELIGNKLSFTVIVKDAAGQPTQFDWDNING